jgi:hypothetical protein
VAKGSREILLHGVASREVPDIASVSFHAQPPGCIAAQNSRNANGGGMQVAVAAFSKLLRTHSARIKMDLGNFDQRPLIG